MPRHHPHKTILKMALLGTLLLAGVSSAFAKSPLAARRILYINSYNNGYAWSDNTLKGIRSVLPMDIQNLNFQVEYLDAKRYETQAMKAALFAYFKAKFRNSRFDVIITSDNNALEFITEYRDKLFPGVPVVFCGVNDFHPNMLEGQTRITGIAETVAFKENMAIMQRLHPNTRKMLVISADNVTSRAIVREIKQTIAQEKIDFNFRFISGFKTPELKSGKPDFLKDLGQDTLIYIVPGGSEESDGTFYNIGEISTMICRATDRPVYSSWEFLMGTGVVGGKLASGLRQGELAAGVAMRILAGEDPDTIPVKTDVGHTYTFDYKVLQKFKVDMDLLPEGSRIINEPYNFYQLNRQLFWVIIAALVVLSGLVVLLILNMDQKKKANLAMETSKAQLQLILDNIPHLVFWQDQALNLVDVNLSFLKFFNIREKESIIGRDIASVPDLAHTAEESRRLGREVLDSATPYYARLLKILRSNNQQVWLEINKIPLLDKKKRVAGVLSTAEDITKKINLKKQLSQAQKMEALGILSGGIAHDFNNILTSIVNSTELAIDDVPEDSMTRKDLDRVLSAGRRGSQLVKQILTFSRPGHVRFRKVNIARVVADAMALVETSLPGNIEVVRSTGPGDYWCHGDATQIHQVIMNLCTNSFQAMGGKSGRIEVGLHNRELAAGGRETRDEAGPFTLSPGSYVEITVTDNGPGIEADILDNIFDPFFSTKNKNIGTGLGLSMVHGIVQGHNGGIFITSVPYEQTQFTVLIPRMEQGEEEEPVAEEGVCKGQGRILFVEDDQEQRQSVPRTIERLGYAVTTAENAGQAIQRIADAEESFDLVITDYDMPKTTGLELARRLAAFRPELPVILVSGRNVEFSRQESVNIRKFIVKPYNKTILSKGIHEVLCTPENA